MPIWSWLFETPLGVGIEAPDFSLADQDGNLIRLAAFRGRSHVVLVFYPGDATNLCTKQLCEFRDSWGELISRNFVVLGINPQSAESHRKFAETQHYPFPLLVDKGQNVARLYHASGFIVRRTVYVISKDGIVRFAERGKPSTDTVLAAVR
ncbi:MAG: peroxiredoxin [Bryobacteraceae bacterium]